MKVTSSHTILSTIPSRNRRAARIQFIKSDLNIIALIGIILLIGIVKKNAILMIDFAVQVEREEGLLPVEAIYKACSCVSSDSDDYHGRSSRCMPLALGAALAPSCAVRWHHHRRRPHPQPDAHALTTPVVYIYMDRLHPGFRRTRSHAPRRDSTCHSD